MSREGAELVRDVTRLHEVGLVYVPAEALAKPAAARAPDERARFAAHYEKGSQLARGAGLPEQVCDWIRLGAERYDGRGPNGLAGAAIPLQARISAPHTAAMPRSQPRRRPPGPTRRRCCAPSRTRRSIHASSRRSLRCSRRVG